MPKASSPPEPVSIPRLISKVATIVVFAASILWLNLNYRNPKKMTALKAGDKFPDGVVFSYVPWQEETSSITACGIPINYDASKEFANKKVVLFAVPGAFTPGCSARHLPSFVDNLSALKAKGVDIIACIAYNDPYVMSAWGKANSIKGNDILFLNDPEVKFSTSIGWLRGERTDRYAMIIDKGIVTYAEKEPGREVTVSGAQAVLAKL